MTIENSRISRGFVIAGLMNLSVLILSRFFTNSTIPEFDPVVMSNFGILMISLWGVAYMSAFKIYDKAKWLVLIFASEKAAYVYVWVNWIVNNDVSDVYEEDIMAGIFYSIYGINDFLFCFFFLFVFYRLVQSKD